MHRLRDALPMLEVTTAPHASDRRGASDEYSIPTPWAKAATV
ncbi:hypothetical protein [Streptomyces sp. NBC_00057]